MTPATKAPPVHEGRVAPPVPWGLLSPTANQEMVPEGRIREGEHELVQAEVALAMAEGYLQNLKSRRTGRVAGTDRIEGVRPGDYSGLRVRTLGATVFPGSYSWRVSPRK